MSYFYFTTSKSIIKSYKLKNYTVIVGQNMDIVAFVDKICF